MSLGGERTDVVLKFYDSWNRGEIDFDELVDEDIVNHQPDVEPELGRDPFREAIAGVMAAVPDSRWDVSDVLADRDRVAIRITWSGTYLGAHFRGWTIPAPAKFAVEHVHIYRVAALVGPTLPLARPGTQNFSTRGNHIDAVARHALPVRRVLVSIKAEIRSEILQRLANKVR
jgi:predicted ester cyclase